MKITEEQALNIMNEYDNLVFKVSYNSGHGRDVRKVEKPCYTEAMRSMNKDYVVQKLVQQHPFFAEFNPSSVNIVRITTINLHGKALALGGIFRIGAPGSFCDLLSYKGKNPRVIGLDEEGRLGKKAVDVEALNVYQDIFGKKICGSIPSYNEMINKVLALHEKFPKCKLIGWDLTVDSTGDIVCIEYNSQIPGIIQTQLVDGPIFGKKLENGKTILEEIME